MFSKKKSRQICIIFSVIKHISLQKSHNCQFYVSFHRAANQQLHPLRMSQVSARSSRGRITCSCPRVQREASGSRETERWTCWWTWPWIEPLGPRRRRCWCPPWLWAVRWSWRSSASPSRRSVRTRRPRTLLKDCRFSARMLTELPLCSWGGRSLECCMVMLAWR